MLPKFDLVVTVAAVGEEEYPPRARLALFVPLPDAPELPNPYLLDNTAATVAAVVDAGMTVLVRCHLGLNRSALVVAVAVHKLTGCPGPAIVEHLRAVRSPVVLCAPAYDAYVRGL
jgi:protein-tyrosine phosphatase